MTTAPATRSQKQVNRIETLVVCNQVHHGLTRELLLWLGLPPKYANVGYALVERMCSFLPSECNEEYKVARPIADANDTGQPPFSSLRCENCFWLKELVNRITVVIGVELRFSHPCIVKIGALVATKCAPLILEL